MSVGPARTGGRSCYIRASTGGCPNGHFRDGRCPDHRQRRRRGSLRLVAQPGAGYPHRLPGAGRLGGAAGGCAAPGGRGRAGAPRRPAAAPRRAALRQRLPLRSLGLLLAAHPGQRGGRRHRPLRRRMGQTAPVGLRGRQPVRRGRRLADPLLGSGALLRFQRPDGGHLGHSRQPGLSAQAGRPAAAAPADPGRRDSEPGLRPARLALVAGRAGGPQISATRTTPL